MGKPKPNYSILKNENIKVLLNEKDICTLICEISATDLKDDSKKEVLLNQLSKHYKNTHCNISEKIQSGRVWLLIKEHDSNSEVLQVAQAIDYSEEKGFFYEIRSHIEEIFGKGENLYHNFAEEIKGDGRLLFYELNIEEYLIKYAPSNYKDFIYRMAREYFAEASIAHFTQAREWRFYNSGMDKRAFYYLIENIKTVDITKQERNDI